MTTEDVSIVNRSKRPKDSKFKQQALPAWQPILTAGTVLPTFFVIGTHLPPLLRAFLCPSFIFNVLFSNLHVEVVDPMRFRHFLPDPAFG